MSPPSNQLKMLQADYGIHTEFCVGHLVIAKEIRDPDRACSPCAGESERQPGVVLVTTQGSLSVSNFCYLACLVKLVSLVS